MKRRKLLLVITALLLVLAGLMVGAYLAYVIAGLLLAFAFYPLQRKLQSRIGPSLSAFGILILTVLLVILPFALTLRIAAFDAVQIINALQEGNLTPIQTIERQLEQALSIQVDLQEELTARIESVASILANSLPQAINALISITLGLTLLLFSQYYGLKDGERFLQWTKKLDIIPTDIQNELYHKISETTTAVIKGHIGVAAVQAAAIGAALLLTDISNAVLWTLIMAITGLIPIIGAAIVWAPASIYLVTLGLTTQAIIFFTWSLVISSLADDILRPYLVDQGADVHPYLIIIGVIGGISVFGAIGIFIGPIIFGAIKASLQIYLEETRHNMV